MLRIILIVGLILWGMGAEVLADGQKKFSCEETCLGEIGVACRTNCSAEICNKDFCNYDNSDDGHINERECKSGCSLKKIKACKKKFNQLDCDTKDIDFNIDTCMGDCYLICHPLCNPHTTEGKQNKIKQDICVKNCIDLKNNKQYQQACKIICEYRQ